MIRLVDQAIGNRVLTVGFTHGTRGTIEILKRCSHLLEVRRATRDARSMIKLLYQHEGPSHGFNHC